MEFTLKDRIRISILASLATLIIRIWFFTVRIEIVNQDIYDDYFRQPGEKKNVVAGSWHRHSIFLFYFFRNLENRLIMISRSKDGEITSKVAKSFGYSPVRGSSTRGGRKALQALIQIMKSGSRKYLCGTPVDGPRGPARKLKRGMVVLARETDSFFIPMACSGTNVITFHKAWDKTIIPKPFSKMVIGFMPPIKIPVDRTGEDFEAQCKKIESDLDQLTDKLDRICGYTGG